MGSRNGLNPKIRGLKGKGFGRPLPAPFGFDNGIKPNGTNNYLTIPMFVGKGPLPINMTIEFWAKPAANTDIAGVIPLIDVRDGLSPNGNKLLGLYANGNIVEVDRDTANINNTPVSDPFTYVSGNKYHFVITVTGYTFQVYRNNILVGGNNIGAPYVTPSVISSFKIFQFNNALYSTCLIDELRFYSKTLSLQQITENYNGGVGQNPGMTEELFIWYNFLNFEPLDFSLAQDNSDVRLGIRDQSGNNNHALPINMETNPASPNYVLKPF